MHKMLRAFAGVAFASAILLPGSLPAQAQEPASMTVGSTTISLGGGFAFITLPDTRFTFRFDDGDGDTLKKQRNSSFDEYGGGFSGSISTPLGSGFGIPWVAAVHGYWSNIEDSNRNRCVTTGGAVCAAADIVDRPGDSTVAALGPGNVLTSHTDREVDSWGAALGLTTHRPTAIILPGIMKSTRWGFAFDVRGLDQDLRINGETAGVSNLFDYRETLDTTYWGGYVTFGGEYSLFKGLNDGLGLRSFVDFHAGIYSADTDYNGRITSTDFAPSRLGLSDDEITFIGGVKFETRKQFSPRASLSLLSEYTWYSYVPGMRYNDGDNGANGIVNQARIFDDDAFVTRTSIRLNIGLGPTQLYEEPVK
jgi:hypothetical protein